MALPSVSPCLWENHYQSHWNTFPFYRRFPFYALSLRLHCPNLYHVVTQLSSSVLDLLQLICISLPDSWIYLHLLFCVHTVGEIIPNAKLFGKGNAGSTGGKKPLLCSKLWSSVFEFAPWGILSILSCKQKGNEWKRRNGNIIGKLYKKSNMRIRKSNPSHQIATSSWSFSVWLGLVLLFTLAIEGPQ